MGIFGIKFVPLNVPWEERLQTLAAGAWIFTIVFSGLCTTYISLYILFYTKYWLPMLLYLIWAWIIDRNTAENGGRRFEWIRGMTWWKYLNDYFPLKLVSVSGVDLEKNKNYLFCCFPHGLISLSVFCTFGTTASGFKKIFPHHTPYLLTLKINFIWPFVRELGLGLGGVSPSGKSLSWILSASNGGNIAVLAVGGASESLNCRPGQYRLCLKNRKGFIKYALKHGSPLVPVFMFGENNLYDQFSNPEGSLLRMIQEKLKNILGFAPVLPIGRGIFQNSFGIIPLKKPLTTVVGKPINFVRTENPSNKEIDELHQHFIDNLITLFEENKHKYITNANDAKIIIE